MEEENKNILPAGENRGWMLWMAAAILIIFAATVYGRAFMNKKTYLASGHPEWPPIMYQDGDEITGVGAELVKMIANDLSIKVETKYAGLWDEVQEKARTGEVDMLVAAYKTEERQTYMDYSEAYTVDPIAVYVKKGKGFTYAGWDDFIDKKGVLTAGDSYGQQFDDFIKEKLDTRRVDTTAEAFNLLKLEQADYFVYALYSGEKAMAESNLGNDIEILPKYVTSENFFITISKKSPLVKYMTAINEKLEQYKKDGTVENLIAKYRAFYLR